MSLDAQHNTISSVFHSFAHACKEPITYIHIYIYIYIYILSVLLFLEENFLKTLQWPVYVHIHVCGEYTLLVFGGWYMQVCIYADMHNILVCVLSLLFPIKLREAPEEDFVKLINNPLGLLSARARTIKSCSCCYLPEKNERLGVSAAE